MEALKTIWDFFQNEVLGMNWLNRLIETILNARHMGEYHRSSARYGNTVLLVFLYSAVYRIYKRRLTTWSYILLFDFFADG